MKLGNDEPIVLTEDRGTAGTIGCMFLIVSIAGIIAKAFGWL